MAMLPNQGPPLAATHAPIPPQRMFQLTGALRQRAQGGRVTMAIVEEVAQQESAKIAEVYAALALDPNLGFEIGQDVLIAICVGGCQAQGAIANLEKLLELRRERLAQQKPAFDVIPRTCLDMCAHSPVCISRSRHGQAAHPRLKVTDVAEIVDSLCD